MAASILPSLCPICKEPILGGQRLRVIGLDQRQRGAPPANITAHATCAHGIVIVWPGQTLEQAIFALDKESVSCQGK